MRELALSSEEFTDFSVPHALCLAGEHQYSLGLAPIVIAMNLRVHAAAWETGGEFEITVAPEPASEGGARELLARWRKALGELVAGDVDRLEGLRISLGLQATAQACPLEVTLSSPAVAIALACAIRAHRGDGATAPDTQVAELAVALLGELRRPALSHPDRFYAECLVCLQGGASYVSPSSAPLNVQLMVPPESLILAVSRRALPSQGEVSWERVLLSAVSKTGGGGVQLLAETERDASRLFELAPGKLDDAEMAVLYGLLRVQEMITQHIEKLGQPLLDHDLLAELCDEESAIIEDYFEFPSAPYRQIRSRAIESGALGAKYTYAWGSQPAMIILAPGVRDEVRGALGEEFDDCTFLPVDVDTEGAGPERFEEAE